MGKEDIQRALDLLDRSAAGTLRLGEQVGQNMGLLGVLRERLKSAQREMKDHLRRNPLDKHRLRYKADRLFVRTVEYLNEIINSLAREGRTPS